MVRTRTYAGPLLPGTSSVRQFNRRPRMVSTMPFKAGASVVAKNKTNYAVKRVYNRRKNYKPSANRNKNAIAVLSRQVRQLQVSKYGDVQYHRYVLVKEDTNVKDILGTNKIRDQKPLIWEMMNFYNEAPAYTGLEDSLTELPTFEKNYKFVPISSLTTNSTFGKPYAFDVTNDTPSLVQYMPLSTFYKFHIKVINLETGKDVKFKLQVFQIKHNSDNNRISTELPDYAGSYMNLCKEDPSDENKLSPYYHRQLYSREYHIKNNSDVTKDCERYFNLKWTFRNQLLRFDNTQIDAGPSGSTQNFAANNFHKVINPNQNIWCCLSTSNSQNNREVQVSIMRTDRWRDAEGVITR